MDLSSSASISVWRAFSKSFFDILLHTLPTNSGDEKIYNTPEDWNAFNIIPSSKSFYTYNGSLPRSPCTELVAWIIMDSPVNMSSDIYKNIRGITGKNSRQIQKRHNRQVYYNENIVSYKTLFEQYISICDSGCQTPKIVFLYFDIFGRPVIDRFTLGLMVIQKNLCYRNIGYFKWVNY